MRTLKQWSMVALTALSLPVMADTSVFTKDQQQAIEKITHDYLVAHPEVLVEASQVLQKQQEQAMQKQAQSAVTQHADALFTDKIAVVGNVKGGVTLVEFFDYQCGHCKHMAPVIQKLIQNNPSLRVVYKALPIFGESSDYASRAALAASYQGKYQPAHEALLNISDRLTAERVDKAMAALGLDMKKLKADMKSKAVTEALKANHDLAEQLHLMGTPAIIVGTTPNGVFAKNTQPVFIPGASTEAALQDLIKQASAQ